MQFLGKITVDHMAVKEKIAPSERLTADWLRDEPAWGGKWGGDRFARDYEHLLTRVSKWSWL
jgi:hypothetical protein